MIDIQNLDVALHLVENIRDGTPIEGAADPTGQLVLAAIVIIHETGLDLEQFYDVAEELTAQTNTNLQKPKP